MIGVGVDVQASADQLAINSLRNILERTSGRELQGQSSHYGYWYVPTGTDKNHEYGGTGISYATCGTRHWS